MCRLMIFKHASFLIEPPLSFQFQLRIVYTCDFSGKKRSRQSPSFHSFISYQQRTNTLAYYDSAFILTPELCSVLARDKHSSLLAFMSTPKLCSIQTRDKHSSLLAFMSTPKLYSIQTRDKHSSLLRFSFHTNTGAL
jgi:hypothetical protein